MFRRLLVCVFAALLLSSCYAHDTAVVVNADGSGVVRVTAGINKLYAQRLESGEVTSLQEYFDTLIQDLPAEWQPQSVPWDDGVYVGSEMTLTFVDPPMLQEQLDQVLAESQSSGYNDLFTSFVVQQQGEKLQITASLVGANQDADGEELPDGPEGDSRLGWSVTFPQLEEVQPSASATLNGNQVSWAFRFSELQEGQELDLVSQGSLVPGAPPATPSNEVSTGDLGATGNVPPTLTSTPTLQPTATATATPIAPSATSPVVAQAPITIATSVPLDTPTEQATLPVEPTRASPVRTTSPVQEPTNIPLATTTSAVLATSVTPAATAIGRDASELVIATPAQVVSSAVAAKADTHAYVPMVASESSQPATEAQLITEPLATSQNASENDSYQNLLIAFLLLCSALCFGYVGMRRLARRQARASSSEAPPPPDQPV